MDWIIGLKNEHTGDAFEIVLLFIVYIVIKIIVIF